MYQKQKMENSLIILQLYNKFMTKTSIYNIPEEVQKAIDRYYDCFDQDT